MASKLFKSLKYSIDELEGSKISLYRKLEIQWLESKTRDVITHPYYILKQFYLNLKIFIPLAYRWRSWDFSYTVTVLCELLKAQARVTKEADRHIGSEKAYRKQMTAAGMLEKAYNEEVDKSIMYLTMKNPVEFTKVGDGYNRMSQKQVTDKRIYDGIYAVADKRSKKAKETRKREAWAYLQKHLESFWS